MSRRPLTGKERAACIHDLAGYRREYASLRRWASPALGVFLPSAAFRAEGANVLRTIRGLEAALCGDDVNYNPPGVKSAGTIKLSGAAEQTIEGVGAGRPTITAPSDPAGEGAIPTAPSRSRQEGATTTAPSSRPALPPGPRTPDPEPLVILPAWKFGVLYVLACVGIVFLASAAVFALVTWWLA